MLIFTPRDRQTAYIHYSAITIKSLLVKNQSNLAAVCAVEPRACLTPAQMMYPSQYI